MSLLLLNVCKQELDDHLSGRLWGEIHTEPKSSGEYKTSKDLLVLALCVWPRVTFLH